MAEQDRVREALVRVLSQAPWRDVEKLALSLGIDVSYSEWLSLNAPSEAIADALLSRPAPEPSGEPVAWAVVGRDAGLMHTAGLREEAEAFRQQLAPSWADGDSWRVVPIHYPAAVSASRAGGEVTHPADKFIAATQGAQAEWQSLTRAVAPHLDGKMSPETFSELLLTYGVACVTAALRPTGNGE